MKDKISLKAARVNAGLTQEEAAKMIGVYSGTVSNWEKGKTFPSPKKFHLIEKAIIFPIMKLIFCLKIRVTHKLGF